MHTTTRSGRVRAVGIAAALALAIMGPPAANAIVVGTGELADVDFDGTPPTLTFDGTVRWDDATFDVLGTPVNLGATFPGSQQLANGVVTDLNFGDFSASFATDILSTSPTGAFLRLEDILGAAVCTAPTCLNATATFLGAVGTVAFDPADLLPAVPLLYFVDGSIALDFTLVGSGPFGLNAVAPQTTPAGAPVAVASGDDAFYDSRQNGVVGFSAFATFTEVTVPGTTLFVPLSAAEGTIPANIVLDPPGLDSVFIDVSTTATYVGPVEVCIVVPDGFMPLDQLRILHREGLGPGSPTGAFVDVTTRIADAPTRVCGVVDSLSPFVVGLDTTPPATTTTTSSTTTTVESTTTTTAEPTTTTVESTTTTTAESTTTTVESTTTTTAEPTTTTTAEPTTTTTTTTTSTTTPPPVCDVAPTFASILCRLDDLIALVEASGLSDPIGGNLLRSLTTARALVATAEDRADAGRTRSAQSKLKAAERRMVSFGFRIRSLSGRRTLPAGLATTLQAEGLPIQEDIKTLRGSL